MGLDPNGYTAPQHPSTDDVMDINNEVFNDLCHTLFDDDEHKPIVVAGALESWVAKFYESPNSGLFTQELKSLRINDAPTNALLTENTLESAAIGNLYIRSNDGARGNSRVREAQVKLRDYNMGLISAIVVTTPLGTEIDRDTRAKWVALGRLNNMPCVGHVLLDGACQVRGDAYHVSVLTYGGTPIEFQPKNPSHRTNILVFAAVLQGLLQTGISTNFELVAPKKHADAMVIVEDMSSGLLYPLPFDVLPIFYCPEEPITKEMAAADLSGLVGEDILSSTYDMALQILRTFRTLNVSPRMRESMLIVPLYPS